MIEAFPPFLFKFQETFQTKQSNKSQVSLSFAAIRTAMQAVFTSPLILNCFF